MAQPSRGRDAAAASLVWIFVLLVIAGGGLLVLSRLLERVNYQEVPTAPTPALESRDEAVIIAPPSKADANVITRDFAPDAAMPRARRRTLITYTVVEGDTVFGIAYKFGLRPETILWSNYDVLKDNFDLIRVGQQFVIPPEDGLIIEVERGDTLDGIARRFGVTPERIVNEPINGLTSVNQPLQVGQRLFVPGGERETVIWQVPKLIPVRQTARGVRVYRVGKCGEVAIPPLGTGSFIYPTNRRYLSGYDFTRYHPGLDFAGRLGEPIYASDSGTVIYAGYSLNAAGVPVGYGQYVVLDHGNGYQTLYAHASQLFVSCGQQVAKGTVIAAIGSVGRSTGPHLHFEIRYRGAPVNPWTLLPPRR